LAMYDTKNRSSLVLCFITVQPLHETCPPAATWSHGVAQHHGRELIRASHAETP